MSFIRPEPADVNAPLAEILLKAGAVLYVKTNIPQTLMVSSPRGVAGESADFIRLQTADSDNNVFGRTLVCIGVVFPGTSLTLIARTRTSSL